MEADRATQPAGGTIGFGPTPAAAAINTPKPPDNLPNYAEEWPQKGGLGDVPQPWDLHNLGLAIGTADDGTVTVSSPHTGQVVQLAPGAPDTISPIVPIHGRPMLTSGSAGDDVVELGQKLGLLGYDNSISKGLNPNGVFDDSIAGAVDAFRRDYDVAEDPSQFPRNARENAASHVGPWTWEGLLRVTKRITDLQATDGRQVAFAR
jgi:peptidoglycan hydrolase-like protein with peptidoglycan-binding domain